jgi:hypothetical protein
LTLASVLDDSAHRGDAGLEHALFIAADVVVRHHGQRRVAVILDLDATARGARRRVRSFVPVAASWPSRSQKVTCAAGAQAAKVRSGVRSQ